MFYKIFKAPIVKKNLIGLKNSSGRNSFGRITIRNRGSGHKKKLRFITFNRMFNSVGIVISIEYDPNRNAYISCIYDINNTKYFYIILPKKLKIGDVVKSGIFAELNLGDNLKIAKIPIGSYIHNVSLFPIKEGIICRAAGTFAIITEKDNRHATVQLSSGEKKLFPLDCTATLGSVSNEQYLLNNIGKAGRSRWLNKRPKVRGVAMNPIDHPHGGGEGKKSGNKILLTPWGKPTQNKKTRKI